MPFASRYLQCAGHEIHYTEWGDPQSPAVIAWHGLARTGRDMDALAAHLAPHYRVICPDTIGRGLSQWSSNPKEHYCLKHYAQIAKALLDQLGIDRVHWVGTSMGGALGMVLASGFFQPAMATRIRSLVLNDNAPYLEAPAIERIRTYAGSPPAFDTVVELEEFFRAAYQPFGNLTDAQWRHLTETSTRRLSDGRVTPHYDPAIVQQFTHHPDDYLLWEHFDALQIPVLCLHGSESDLVVPATLDTMRARGPGAAGRLQIVDIAGCGHAPALNVPQQWDLVERFIGAAATTS
jgi:pimeloyl-ACP methyl ester carboxylesterase